MKPRLIFYGKYILYWLSVFLFFKLVFVLYHLSKMDGIGISDFIGIFTHGLKLDLSIIGYIMLLPTIVLMLFSSFKNKFENAFIDVYTLIIIIPVIILELIDLELYNYWRFRLDNAFAENLASPKELLANVSYLQLSLLIFLVIFLTYVIYGLHYKKIIKRGLPPVYQPDWKTALIFILLLPSLFLPIRGGVSTAPLNTGSVYFHKKIVVNHAAINPIWNLLYSVTESDKLRFSVNFYNEEKEKKILTDLYFPTEKPVKLINTLKPNIILIIIESFSAGVVNELTGIEGVTPNFSKLVKEGVFFTNFYASGSSSPLGIGAINSGYPALPNTCVLYYEDKTQSLPGIAKGLDKLGYSTCFYYGGDINFAHFKSFLINSGFHRIVSSVDFPASDYLSKWGVPDHLVFRRLLDETNKAAGPFFHSYFTLSSHEPFEVPMETIIKGNDPTNKYFNSIYYTDKYLGEFIENAKQQPWWKNTLIILAADHGARIEDIAHFDRRRFHIPMLWLGGALAVKDTVISKYASQVDIPKTLLNQMELPTDDFKFSKDILSEESKSFAFYSCQNALGFVSDSTYLIFDLNSNKYLIETGDTAGNIKDYPKANVQRLLRDFKER